MLLNTGCTVGLGELFGCSVEEMHAGQFHITRWLPTFEKMLLQLQSPQGVEIPVTQANGEVKTVRLWLSALPVTGEALDWYVAVFIARVHASVLTFSCPGSKCVPKS